MATYRLTWTQQGQRHGQDFADAGAAAFVMELLASNFAVSGLELRELGPDEPRDLSGPRPLHGPRGGQLLDQAVWRESRRQR